MKLAPPKRILEIYFDNPYEIGNAEIKELFGTKSSTTVCRLKRRVQEAMQKQGKKTWNSYNVNTTIAFETWGIDIDNIERLYKKQERLGLVKNDESESETNLGKVINL